MPVMRLASGLLAAGSSPQEGEDGQQACNAGGSQCPQGVPAGRIGPCPGLPEAVFLALHPVVMVQQARLVGAGPAVARVELAWLVVVLDQHGHSSSMYLAGTLRARL